MSTSHIAELEARVAALEARVDTVEQPRAMQAPLGGESSAGSQVASPYALLEVLEEKCPGTVAVVGSVEVDEGSLRWQYALPQRQLVESDWSDATERFAALGSAARLAVLRVCLTGPRRVAELVKELGFDSLGQLNHHVRVLTAAGWLHSVGRGVVQVPPARVVPLLAVLVALN